MPIHRILLVGHCGFDASNLRAAIGAAVDVPVSEALHADDATAAGPDTLLLINRQLGYGFGVQDGVELIRRLAQNPQPPAMMLVSNYADAQQAAVEAGALPGFGKAELGTAVPAQRLREAVGERSSSSG